MEIKSVSGFTLFARDLNKTSEFYESLGFRPGPKTDEAATVYMNWFSIKFVDASKFTSGEFSHEAQAEPKGSGIFINIKVDEIDDFYQNLLDKGFKPSSEPRNWPWGNREFVLRDPDGYKLVFFQNSKDKLRA